MKKLPLRTLPWFEKDAMVAIYEEYGLQEKLRVVVSEKVSERADGDGKEEPWYLLTNGHTAEKTWLSHGTIFALKLKKSLMI